MQFLRTLTFLISILFVLSGCVLRYPTVTAVYIPGGVPRPNTFVESEIWDRAKPAKIRLRRTLAETGEVRRAEVRAIRDDRAISLMISWEDPSEPPERRAWSWNRAAGRYELVEYPVDSLAVHWPLGEPRAAAPAFCMLEGVSGAFDAWEWIANWTNLSGFAEDRRLEVLAHPPEFNPALVPGGLYPSRKGDALMQFVWEPDSGRPGTVERPRPSAFERSMLPGGEGREATGSAADVLALGFFQRAQVKRPDNWYVTKKERVPGYMLETDPKIFRSGVYIVEFYRVLVTAGDEEDYQMRGNGPHWFSIAAFDNQLYPDHFSSGPIRLMLEAAP